MAVILNAFPRTTHKYVGTYKHLDKYGTPVLIKMLGGRKVERYEDYYVGPIYYNRIVLPAGTTATFKQVRNALYGEFSKHGCHHEYDCCGCASTSVTVTRVSKREYLMERSISYNY